MHKIADLKKKYSHKYSWLIFQVYVQGKYTVVIYHSIINVLLCNALLYVYFCKFSV